MTKILIVDDNEINLKIHRDFLEIQGYHVLVATDGYKAFQIISTEMPDLILMDLYLPNQDGIEITRQLKTTSQTHHIPIIALTALATVDKREAFFQAGGDGYLVKPFTIEKLLSETKRILASA